MAEHARGLGQVAPACTAGAPLGFAPRLSLVTCEACKVAIAASVLTPALAAAWETFRAVAADLADAITGVAAALAPVTPEDPRA